MTLFTHGPENSSIFQFYLLQSPLLLHAWMELGPDVELILGRMDDINFSLKYKTRFHLNSLLSP